MWECQQVNQLEIMVESLDEIQYVANVLNFLSLTKTRNRKSSENPKADRHSTAPKRNMPRKGNPNHTRLQCSLPHVSISTKVVLKKVLAAPPRIPNPLSSIWHYFHIDIDRIFAPKVLLILCYPDCNGASAWRLLKAKQRTITFQGELVIGPY